MQPQAQVYRRASLQCLHGNVTRKLHCDWKCIKQLDMTIARVTVLHELERVIMNEVVDANK